MIETYQKVINPFGIRTQDPKDNLGFKISRLSFLSVWFSISDNDLNLK